jgi:hypothetical protein
VTAENLYLNRTSIIGTPKERKKSKNKRERQRRKEKKMLVSQYWETGSPDPPIYSL